MACYFFVASLTDWFFSLQECGSWTVEPGLGRCASCISKLGAMSRSSTAANTPGAGFSPAWVMDNPNNCHGKLFVCLMLKVILF